MSDTEKEAALQELAEKYSADNYRGVNRVELMDGIILCPDVIKASPSGFLQMFFKGKVPPNEDRYETVVYFPLNSIEAINGQYVDQYAANLTLGNYYFYLARNLQKAKECYEKALKIHPEEKVVIENLGYCYMKTKEFKKAVELGEKAINLYPHNENVWFNLGMAYLALGDNQKAIKCYGKVLLLNPDSKAAGMVHANLGSIYYHEGKIKEAEYHLKKAKTIFKVKNDKRGIEIVDEVLKKIQNSLSGQKTTELDER